MSLIPHLLLPLVSTFLVTEAQLRRKSVNLSDVTSGEADLGEGKRRQELDKNKEFGEEESGRLMWEGRMKAKKELMWEGWEGRVKAKKERLQTQKIERCLLQGGKILITSSKMPQY